MGRLVGPFSMIVGMVGPFGEDETHSIAGKLNSLELVFHHQNGRFWVKMFFFRCPFLLYSDKFPFFFDQEFSR